jgi:hypothetical protein
VAVAAAAVVVDAVVPAVAVMVAADADIENCPGTFLPLPLKE